MDDTKSDRFSAVSHTVALICHPETSIGALHAIEVQVTSARDGDLALNYRLSGDIARLLLPAPQLPSRADDLWRHTCCEAFIAVAGDAAYREFNFSPSGQWAAYAFSDYRQRDEAVTQFVSDAVSPQIDMRPFPDRLELDAVISAAALPPNPTGATLQLGLSTVVESVDGEHAYWALRHTTARPDFHRRDAFVLELADPRANRWKGS
jgi:hypothetical protein